MLIEGNKIRQYSAHVITLKYVLNFQYFSFYCVKGQGIERHYYNCKNAKKSVSFNEIHFQLRMRKLIVIRILNIVKKVSAYIYVSQKSTCLKTFLLLNIINPALYMCYLFGCHSFVNSCYV